MNGDRSAHPDSWRSHIQIAGRGGLAMLVALVALASPAAGSGDMPVRVHLRGWRIARPIILPQQSGPGLVYLPLDERALSSARALSEYRILDSEGREVPYRMIEERGQTETYSLDTMVIAHSQPADRPQELILDARPHPESPLVLHLNLSGAKQGIVASAEGSADRKVWRLLGNKSATPAQGSTVDEISVPLNRQADRYFRIRVAPLGLAIPKIESASLELETLVARVELPVPAAITIKQTKENDGGTATLIQADPGRQMRDLDSLKLEIAEPAFDRPVTLEQSEGKSSWSQTYMEPGSSGSQAIKRLAAGDPVSLPLGGPSFGPYTSTVRLLRATIHNGSDHPLTIGKITLYRFRRGLIFQAIPDRQYSLWYGRFEDVETREPDYEIARLPLIEPPGRLPLAQLGEGVEQPPPWSERHPALIWTALTLAVVLLVGAVVRSMRGLAHTTESEPRSEKSK